MNTTVVTEARRSTRVRKTRPEEEEQEEPTVPPTRRRRTQLEEPTRLAEATERNEALANERKAKADARAAKALEKAALALKRQQQREEKKLLQQKRVEQKAEKKRLAEMERLRKRELKAAEAERKRVTKELRKKAREVIQKQGFASYLKEKGVTTTGSPEALTTLLRHARNYHAQHNGNAITTASTPNRLDDEAVATLKARYTSQSEVSAVLTQVESLLPTIDAPAPEAPLEVHSTLPDPRPLSLEDALTKAHSSFVAPSEGTSKQVQLVEDLPEQEEDLSDDVLSLDESCMLDSQVDDAISSAGESVCHLDPRTTDAEIQQLVAEHKELERQYHCVQQVHILKTRNQELRSKIAALK